MSVALDCGNLERVVERGRWDCCDFELEICLKSPQWGIDLNTAAVVTWWPETKRAREWLLLDTCLL